MNLSATSAPLAGQVAFVTGAARGQGRSHAVHLAELGADIIAVDICAQIDSVPYPLATRDDLDETSRMVEKAGRRIVDMVADVRDGSALTAAVDEGVRELGRLDIVVANAGILPPFREGPGDTSLRDALDVNLIGVHHTLDASIGHLVAGGRGGSIVLISSLAALRPLRVGAGYTESKHALVGMMRALAVDLAQHRIRVNTIHPTTVETPMVCNDWSYKLFRPDLERPTLEDCVPAMTKLNLLPVPFVAPEDISHAIGFLVSDAARYITGATIPVDAGAFLR